MKILTAACALAVLVAPIAAGGQEAQIPNASGTPAAAAVPAADAVLGVATNSTPALITDIERAKTLLSQVTLNSNIVAVYRTTGTGKKAKKKLTGYQVASKDVAVAVLNPATDEIFVVRGTQRDKSMSFSDPNVSVQLTGFNGVNSRFKVTEPDGGFVIAIRYLIAPDTGGTKQAITSKMRHATYVPYSPALQQPEVIAYGERYLMSVIERATYELQLYPSVSDPGKTLPEAVKPALIRALVLAEHTNGGELAAADERTDVEQVIGRVHVLFAGNGPDTYRYSGSSAGALGISQFIASTYRGLVDRHPRANLEPDFVRGMENHVNSIKATYLLIDDYIAAVHSRAKNGFASGSAFDYGAAAYNGGVVRVARAVNAFGQNWNQDRGDQLSAAKAQISGTQSEVNSLTSLVKKTKDKKAKAQLQSQLNDARSRLASAKDQLSNLENATLRAETQGYLQKIYKVISVLNASHEPVQS